MRGIIVCAVLAVFSLCSCTSQEKILCSLYPAGTGTGSYLITVIGNNVTVIKGSRKENDLINLKSFEKIDKKIILKINEEKKSKLYELVNGIDESTFMHRNNIHDAWKARIVYKNKVFMFFYQFSDVEHHPVNCDYIIDELVKIPGSGIDLNDWS